MKKQRLFTATWRLSLSAFMMIFVLQLSGQNVRLTIDSPASISGEYGVNIAGFGPEICDLPLVSGSFVLVSDGSGSLACDTVMNDLTGQIAVIDRGVCNFSIKVFNAQQAGADAVLVLNNDPDNALITMAPGDFANEVTIPSFFMRTTDGEALKAELSEGVTGSFDRIDVVDDFDGEVVYYEDFNGGFNGWSTTGLSCFGTGAENAAWEWVDGGSLQSDCFGTGFITQSPTRCNGVLLFHSEFNDNLGDCTDGLGLGPCPAPQVAQLTSPPIDLTGSDAESYSLRFHQMTGQFQSDYMITWSIDGGVTWDTSAVNTQLETFDLVQANPVISVPLPGTGGADSVIVRLTYFANYYFWAIDDMQIVAQEANNLQVNEDFYALPPNAQFPLSQAEPISFLADIENVGALTQPNTTLNVSIFSQGGQEVFNEDLEYGNVPGNTLVENVPFGETFVPTDTGTYLGLYQLRSDSMDFDTTNNTLPFTFRVTEQLFAKEGGATTPIVPAAGNWDAGEVHSWAYGNHFYVPNGDGQFIRTLQFALGDPAADIGQSIALAVYEWPDDANNDGIADRGEIAQVGFDIYTITGNEAAGGIIEVPFPTFDDPIPLKNDMAYLVMLEYYASDETTVSFAASEEFDYNATVFLSQVQGMARYSGVLGVEGDLSTANFSTVGFGRDVVPVVRMTVGSEPVTSTREVAQHLNDQFYVFPNPTAQQLNVRLALSEQADEARVEIFDMSGRLQWYRTWSQVRTEQLPVDVSNLPSGTYTVRIVTNNGVGSQRFMITGQ